jgi:hypothetical protein
VTAAALLAAACAGLAVLLTGPRPPSRVWRRPRRPRQAAAPATTAPEPGGRTLEALTSALHLATVTGSGPVALIRAAAQEERSARAAHAVRAARRLGVLVLLPTGLCLLPAFVLLTVVPLVLQLVLG